MAIYIKRCTSFAMYQFSYSHASFLVDSGISITEISRRFVSLFFHNFEKSYERIENIFCYQFVHL